MPVLNRALIIIICISMVYSLQTQAKPATDYISIIKEKNQHLSSLLKDRASFEKTVTFMHDTISDSAVFEMSMSNSTLPASAPQQNIKLSKSDYINSFVQGAHLIDQYDVTITTVDVTILDGGKTAVSKEIMTEQGIAVNPYDAHDQGKAFISTTHCVTTHALSPEKAISIEAKCHTDTSYLNDV